MPAGYHPLADGPSDADLRDYLALVRQTVAKHVAGMPDHAAFSRSIAKRAKMASVRDRQIQTGIVSPRSIDVLLSRAPSERY